MADILTSPQDGDVDENKGIEVTFSDLKIDLLEQ
jgi:hypothetical protein